jgi:hypothetical protein
MCMAELEAPFTWSYQEVNPAAGAPVKTFTTAQAASRSRTDQQLSTASSKWGEHTTVRSHKIRADSIAGLVMRITFHPTSALQVRVAKPHVETGSAVLFHTIGNKVFLSA